MNSQSDVFKSRNAIDRLMTMVVSVKRNLELRATFVIERTNGNRPSKNQK